MKSRTTRLKAVQHEFVEYVPEDLEDGVVYVSPEFRVAVHSCLCGCQCEVVTPLDPEEWRVTFDGTSITLAPSIGNWAFPCRSHYIIERGQVIWVEQSGRASLVERSARLVRLRRWLARRLSR